MGGEGGSGGGEGGRGGGEGGTGGAGGAGAKPYWETKYELTELTSVIVSVRLNTMSSAMPHSLHSPLLGGLIAKRRCSPAGNRPLALLHRFAPSNTATHSEDFAVFATQPHTHRLLFGPPSAPCHGSVVHVQPICTTPSCPFQ
jgi:hypothetical protein